MSPVDHHEHTLAAHEIAKVFPALGTSSASLDDYKELHNASIEDSSTFWIGEANKWLEWFVSPRVGLQGDFDAGDVRWFAGGKLNVSYNCLDRMCEMHPNKIAIVAEGDEPDDIRKLTFLQTLRFTCQIANALTQQGVQRGDVVTIYMPMIPELAMTMLACTRIGAVHSVVFAGFSAEALAQRMSAAQSAFLVTADIGKRGGKTIPLKEIVDVARTKLDVEDILKTVFVWERFYKEGSEEAPYEMKPKDLRMNVHVAKQRPYSVPEWMDAEDNLFILYTSGSTGKPKGLVHTTGGYALFAAFTSHNSFDLKEGDLFACVADCGWITGHTYVVYGPLLNGCTTFMFESTPVYPDAGRYWDMIQRHNITQFYTAPTAIRLLMRYGEEIPKKYDVSKTVRVLGTVGEPINPEAWRFYYEVVGKGKCTVVDTYWQTETGGHMITNLPGITPMKPGSCTLPSYGVEPVVLDSLTGQPVTEPDENGKLTGVLAIKQPWPGMARTCLNDHERFLRTYLHVYKGYYFSGDSVVQDKDGYFWIIGRVDDVVNVSGHRIGTAEVESALVAHASVAQAAVVGFAHEIKGQAIAAFVMLVDGHEESPELLKDLKSIVRQEIGGFAAPDLVIVAPTLPMTRSGKIMRRILRKIVNHEVDSLGDTSTLADPSIVDILIEKFAQVHK
ncbi:hypothetical protein ACA910_003123 [Epithemia clementina (nom. ined.)]